MMPGWASLNATDRDTSFAVTAFLKNRLEEQATVDWALRLSPSDTIKRVALLDLLNSPDGDKICEPWRTAWRLIEENWNKPAVDRSSIGAVFVRQRLQAGERTGSLVTAIVKLVTPLLKVKAFSSSNLYFGKLPRRPKKFADIFWAGLSSGEMLDPAQLELGRLTDVGFLHSLAVALDAAVNSGLDMARCIGWVGEHKLWRLERFIASITCQRPNAPIASTNPTGSMRELDLR